MSLRSVSCIVLLTLTSCAKQPTHIKFQLTVEQKARQKVILEDITLKPDKLVGRSRTDFSELFKLADERHEIEESTYLVFDLTGISDFDEERIPGNDDGVWLVIETTGDRIVATRIALPTECNN